MSWFNDYLYLRTVVKWRGWGFPLAAVWALMVTFTLSGLWPGAFWTFILFGVVHGIALCLEIVTRKCRKRLVAPIPTAGGGGARLDFVDEPAHPALVLTQWEILIAIELILFLEIVQLAQSKLVIRYRLRTRPSWQRMGIYWAMSFAFLLLGSFNQSIQFICFQF